MSVLKYFKNTPGRPHRATGPKCNFILQIRNEVPGKKGHVAHPWGDRGLSHVGGERQGPLPLYKPWPPYAAIPFVI